MDITSGMASFRISPKHTAILMAHSPSIQGLIPHAKELRHKGRLFTAVPHRPTETQLLNNMGFKIPPPILHHYDWCDTTPFDSQRVTAAMMVAHKRAYVLSDMGTGKTRAALYATDYLMKVGEIKRVLIIAPLSTLSTVWEHEVFSCFPHRTAVSLHGTKKQRLKKLAEEHDYYIINHDGLEVIKEELIARDDIQAVVVDELAVLRNANTTRWKVTNAITHTRDYVWGMTGGPMPKDPTDVYGQAKLLTPTNVPRYFKTFKNETMTQITPFKWLPRPDAKETAFRALQPAVRYKLDDCVDIPPITVSTREVVLTKEQAVAYKQMKEEYFLQMAEGEITAMNAGVQTSKLLQIGAGFAYGRDGVVAAIPHAPRINELREIINGTDRKVIVFTPFKRSVELLQAQLEVDYDTEHVSGDVNKSNRDRIFYNFQHTNNIKVLVAHPQCMAHGLTLTAANIIVWYSPLPNLEIYEQASARIRRPGQKHHTHIIHLQATPIEKRIYSTLEKRGNMQGDLLSMFRAEMGL